MKQPDFKFLIAHPAYFFGLGFGSGLAPNAPGMLGTLIGFPLFWILSSFMKDTPGTQLMVILALFLMGIYFCHATGKALGQANHSSIVWGKVVTVMLVLALTTPQVLDGVLNWFFYWLFNYVLYWLIVLLFVRLFDNWKPFPIRLLNTKLKYGFGVMASDLFTAIYAIIAFYLTMLLIVIISGLLMFLDWLMSNLGAF
jgi:phosphatidylglycerophosphatase A